MKATKIIMALCLTIFTALVVGCASTKQPCHMEEAWLKGTLCQEIAQEARRYFEQKGEYPSAELLMQLAPIDVDDPAYYIRRVPNLYTHAQGEPLFRNEFQYYAEKGVIHISSPYQESTEPGVVVITTGQDGSRWFHTQLATDLLLKCSRRELTASAAAQQMSRWTIDEAARPVIEKYALGSINGFLREGDFSEALAFGYAQGIADVISDPSCVPPSLR